MLILLTGNTSACPRGVYQALRSRLIVSRRRTPDRGTSKTQPGIVLSETLSERWLQCVGSARPRVSAPITPAARRIPAPYRPDRIRVFQGDPRALGYA